MPTVRVDPLRWLPPPAARVGPGTTGLAYGPRGRTCQRTITLSSCKGGSAGGSSKPVATSSLASGGTFTWVNGNTTTFNTPKLKSSKMLTAKCVAKYGSGASEESATGTVTAQSGTGDSPIPGVFKAKVCIDSAGNIHALTPATIR